MSSWSGPAQWSMGLLDRSDWGAKWIWDPAVAVSPKVEEEAAGRLNYGYHSKSVKTADTEKWVVLDLGHEQEIDAVKLFPVITLDDSPQAAALFFPHRFKVEVANTPQFEDARTVIDRTAEDIPEPHTVAQLYKMKPVTARYIRLIVTGLRMPRRSDAIYALSEIQVLSNGTNLAQNAKVSVSDSDESPGWSKERLIDGVTKTVFPPPLVQPSAYLRKDFDIPGELIRATVYVTARGVYELRLNSQRVGDHLLAPEWTSYHHRLQYQTYDVTPLVREGQNAMGAILAAGWYSGRIGLVPRRRVYGPFPQLLLRLDVELRSGKTVSVVSNDSWQKASDVPLESSDILDGEIYDARKEMKGWDSWGFQAKGWQSVETDADLGAAKLVWQPNEAIRIVKEINPINRTQPKPGIAIFDLGQNIVGWCRLRVHGKAGDVITARYAEMLNEDGTLYTANLRGAPATDRFVLNGEGEETLEWRNAP